MISMPVLVIQHAVTHDMEDGQSLPPIIEDGVIWHVVRRTDGCTTWRRLFLSPFSRRRLARGTGRSDRSAIRRRHVDMRKYSGETFIKVDDVRSGPIRVQIAVVKEGKYDKPNLVFETGEVLGLNATNNRTLLRAYGPDSADWTDKEIDLFLGEIKFEGKLQEAVLVRPISPSIAAKEKAAAAKKLGDEMDDQITF